MDTPVRAGIEATGFGVAAAEDEVVDVLDDAGLDELHAARENISEPAAATPARVLMDERMKSSLQFLF
ncbi:hypothetical protein [Tersicoccus phoenicis]|uniref:hypothetical protein n=1 Tax=Tersicoccus phoenicis TaxID=554083 RepID=UPI001F1F34D3|nr:hypothetical protein [Tersicoccus phoenicis]